MAERERSHFPFHLPIIGACRFQCILLFSYSTRFLFFLCPSLRHVTNTVNKSIWPSLCLSLPLIEFWLYQNIRTKSARTIPFPVMLTGHSSYSRVVDTRCLFSYLLSAGALSCRSVSLSHSSWGVLKFFSINTCTSEDFLGSLSQIPASCFFPPHYHYTSHPHHQCMGSGVSEAVRLYPQIIAALLFELSFLLTDSIISSIGVNLSCLL